MKLIDILARELKVWPEGVVTAVQDLDGEVKFDNSHEMPRINRSKDVWVRQGNQGDSLYPKELAEDYSHAIITRAKWQAAVDALEAEVRPTESVALHYQEVGRITRQWNGDGLPPVGTVCEYLLKPSNQWHKCEIRYHMIPSDFGELRAIVWNPNLKFDQISNSNWEFRPIRTPEQIAAEERAAGIQALKAIFDSCSDELMPTSNKYLDTLFGAIHDAGYRKFEIVDN